MNNQSSIYLRSTRDTQLSLIGHPISQSMKNWVWCGMMSDLGSTKIGKAVSSVDSLVGKIGNEVTHISLIGGEFIGDIG